MPTTPYTTPTFRLFRICLLASLIGLLAGVAAFLLLKLIAVLSNAFFYGQFSLDLPNISTNPLGIWLPLLPAMGGLVVGFLARWAPQIQGHGIPEAMEAVVFHGSKIRPRVALLKPISAALAIGTGGPFGAEGPIIQTGGAIGSLMGQFISTTAAERKVLLACGAAAGMAATFSTPLSAVILAIELLLFEFKSRSFIPLVIAATLATNVHFVLFGWGPLFTMGPVDFGLPGQLPCYLGLGVLAGGGAVLTTRALYWLEDKFDESPIPPRWRPAAGGFAFGLLAMVMPSILGVGYETITGILNNHFELKMLLGIMVFKLLGMLITLGSGTSGGLLAPTFMASAAMGGAYAIIINAVVPGAQLMPGAYALAAMAAVFGAASRSTFAFVVFAFEITRNYDAILPIMLVAVVADGIGLVFLPNSIMTEKLARRGLRIHQDYESDPLQQVLVSEVMKKDVPTLSKCDSLQAALESAAFHEHRVLPLLDEQDRIAGVLTRGDLLRSLQLPQTELLAASSAQVVVAHPDETVSLAVSRMIHSGHGHLPVVDPACPDRLLGMLSRENVLKAYEKRHVEEHLREDGWLL